MRYVIWCEVNRAWEDVCLVWLYSLCRAVVFCEHEIKVVIFYDVDKVTSESSSNDCELSPDVKSFTNRVQQIGMRFNIEVEVELFSSRDFVSDLSDNFCEGRCIDKNSVGIAISRIMNYNKLLSDTGNQIQPMMLSADNSSCSHNVINSNLRICNPNTPADSCSTDNGIVYIHCDIDGIFLEDSNLELLFDGIDSIIADNDSSSLLIGVNEYDDIHNALAKTHSEEFMKRLDGVYLNCGFICFYNVPTFDLTELKSFLLSEDSYCLEQDYLNLLGCDNTNPSLTRICLQPQYNYTYRKMLVETPSQLDTQTEPQSLTLPVFVHYYGSDKPFLPNPKSSNGIDADVPPTIAHYYFPEYGQLVFKIRCLLSVDFVNLVRKRCVEEYWVEQNTNIV